MTAPRADTKAILVITKPYRGILYRGEWWTEREWAARERRRAQWRAYRQKQRA